MAARSGAARKELGAKRTIQDEPKSHKRGSLRIKIIYPQLWATKEIYLCSTVAEDQPLTNKAMQLISIAVIKLAEEQLLPARRPLSLTTTSDW